MTRKRFIKLLMARGETRNDANRIATILRLHETPYLEYIKEVYWDIDKLFNDWKETKQ